MKKIKTNSLFVLALSLGFWWPLSCVRTVAAEVDSSIPGVIRTGLDHFQKQRPELGVEAWKEGGLVREEFRSVSHANYFRDAESALGKYISHEWVATKMIGKSSKVVYLAMNYQRGAVYARFLVYRTEKDWVVQSMNFNTRPEVLMPWLAFEEGE